MCFLGFGTQQTNNAGGGLFGAASATTGSTSLFGNTATGATAGTGGASGGLFGGGSTFGQQQQGGTVHKFNAPSGTDTMLKSGQNHSINTRHQCITAMKEYETKSLEVRKNLRL